jgi:hypothetical protein
MHTVERDYKEEKKPEKWTREIHAFGGDINNERAFHL